MTTTWRWWWCWMVRRKKTSTETWKLKLTTAKMKKQMKRNEERKKPTHTFHFVILCRCIFVWHFSTFLDEVFPPLFSFIHSTEPSMFSFSFFSVTVCRSSLFYWLVNKKREKSEEFVIFFHSLHSSLSHCSVHHLFSAYLVLNHLVFSTQSHEFIFSFKFLSVAHCRINGFCSNTVSSPRRLEPRKQQQMQNDKE